MKAVIFDKDGLMFDTERLCIQAWDYAGEKIGIGRAGYMVLKTLGMNAASTEEIWRKEFGGRCVIQEMRQYSKEFFTEYFKENTLPVKEGLYILLDYLKDSGYKMAVASSSRKEEVDRHLQEAGITDYFQEVVGGDMVGRSKPEPDIYLRACELLEEEPGDCYALEDSRNGLLSAYRAGCVPLMVPDLWQPDQEILDIIAGRFDDLAEVRDYIRRNSESA